MDTIFAIYEHDIVSEEDYIIGIFTDKEEAIRVSREKFLKNKADFYAEYSEEDRQQIGEIDYYVSNYSVKELQVNKLSYTLPIRIIYRTRNDIALWVNN